MADLRIAYDELARARMDIDDATSTFARAERLGSELAGLVGHDRLARKVNEFSDSWDINRDKLEKSLEFISDSLSAIIDTFTELDSAQAKALRTRGSGH
jgi:hypothetical protein